MAELSTKIKLYVNADIDFRSDVILKDEGQGSYIAEWNLEKAKPTDAQLNALETQANEYEANLITSKENKKASAKQKLQDLGLTVDEIKEAFGI
jgi:hypothetical protein